MSIETFDAEKIYAVLLAQLTAAIQSENRMPFLIGVHSGGAWVAERLHQDLKLTTPLGVLSSAFHRDDYSARGLPTSMKPTQIGFDVNGADIVVVDDILFTGRTVRAVLNELFDYGRPKRIELAVMLDRGGRELPVAARYIGLTKHLGVEQNFVLSMNTLHRFDLRIE
jgi:pyrimidine operon attenuation protein / uracil phosphoribosyltransferase